MKTKIVRIGNSQGIRIPKVLLNQTGLHDEVDIQVECERLIIQSPRKTRAGWTEAFAAMAENKDDALLDSVNAMDHSFDEEEWEWK